MGKFTHDPLQDDSTEGEGESSLILLALCYGSTFEFLLEDLMKSYHKIDSYKLIPQILLMMSLVVLVFMILTLINNALVIIGFAWLFRSLTKIELTNANESDTESIDMSQLTLDQRDEKAQIEWTKPMDAWNPKDEWKTMFVKLITLGLTDEKTKIGKILYKLAEFDWPKVFQTLCVGTLIWIFLLALSLMGTGFKLLGGKDSAKMFDVVDNPMSGLMIGILITVLVQSSSTSTSIIISLVGANELSVKNAISMIMGANIGTSVTNTIVAMGHFNDKDQLRRGFAAATVHDTFNFLTVFCIMPIQWASNFLGVMTYSMAKGADPCQESKDNECESQDFLKPYISPYSKGVADYDKNVATYVATNFCMGKCDSIGDLSYDEVSSLFCERGDPMQSWDCSKIPNMEKSWMTIDGHLSKERTPAYVMMGASEIENVYLTECPLQSDKCEDLEIIDTTNYTIGDIYKVCDVFETGLCDSRLLKGGLFKIWGYTDSETGSILVIISLSGICCCLFLIITHLQSLIKGPFTLLLRKALEFNGYISILIGMFITLMVQSSSITTSALTPLAAVGIISLEQMYPLTLGANIGTTCTGIWAASVAVSHPVEAWQVALAHLFFNIIGICIWYPIPYMRNIPLRFSRFLGTQTTKWNLFPLAYVSVIFFAIPGIAYAIAANA